METKEDCLSLPPLDLKQKDVPEKVSGRMWFTSIRVFDSQRAA
jgi:hypothetical protein